MKETEMRTREKMEKEGKTEKSLVKKITCLTGAM